VYHHESGVGTAHPGELAEKEQAFEAVEHIGSSTSEEISDFRMPVYHHDRIG